MLPLCRWSSHMHTSQSSLRPSEHLETRMCSATNELSRYIVTIYKTWGQRACTRRLDRFALSPQVTISSVQFSHQSCLTLPPHESQHARPPCPSPTPGVDLNSCPSSWWRHPAISSSVVPFSSCPQSLPASGLLQRVSSSHEVAKVLEFQLQHQSFQWTPRTDLL